jgi:hypothetical protein
MVRDRFLDALAHEDGGVDEHVILRIAEDFRDREEAARVDDAAVVVDEERRPGLDGAHVSGGS